MANSLRRLFYTALFLPLVFGCFPKRMVVEERPLRTASLEELVELQKERARTIQDLRALMTVRPEGERSFTASLKFLRDAGSGSPGIHVRGFDPLGRTVFELISGKGDFRIRVSQNGRMTEFGPGSPEIEGLPVSPADFFRMISAVVGPVIDPAEIPVLESRGRDYLIHLVRFSDHAGRFSKRLWINREDLSLSRVEFFGGGLDKKNGPDSAPGVVIDLKENQVRATEDGNWISWPRRVRVGHFISEAREIPAVKLEFKEVHFNEGGVSLSMSSHKRTGESE